MNNATNFIGAIDVTVYNPHVKAVLCKSELPLTLLTCAALIAESYPGQSQLCASNRQSNVSETARRSIGEHEIVFLGDACWTDDARILSTCYHERADWLFGKFYAGEMKRDDKAYAVGRLRSGIEHEPAQCICDCYSGAN